MSGKSLTIKNSPRPPKFAQRGEPPHATSLRVSPSPCHSYRNYLGGYDMAGTQWLNFFVTVTGSNLPHSRLLNSAFFFNQFV